MWKQGLGSTIHCVAGDATGIILFAAEAAPLICAGITTYKRLKMTEAREWVVIRARAAPGHLAIQYAKTMGLQVCAMDIEDSKLALAKELGTSRSTRPMTTLRRP